MGGKELAMMLPIPGPFLKDRLYFEKLVGIN